MLLIWSSFLRREDVPFLSILLNLRMSPAIPTKPVLSIAQPHNKGGIEQSELREPLFFFYFLKNVKKLMGLKSSLSFIYPCLLLRPAITYVFLVSAYEFAFGLHVTLARSSVVLELHSWCTGIWVNIHRFQGLFQLSTTMKIHFGN